MPRDPATDALLSTLAVLPQAVNTFATSFLVERLTPLPYETLHRLHRARPWLDGLSLLASAQLLARGQAWPAVPMAAALKGLARLVTAQDAHPPHERPLETLDAPAMGERLRPEEPVLGLFLNGEARCYPIRLIRTPAALHDSLGGEPVAVTWNPMSRAAVALRDDWQGRRLRLEVAGAPGNELVFFDARSGGLVAQLAARIMTGPNRGAPLPAYPLAHTTWAAWRSLHPETTGVWFDPGPQDAYINWLLDRAEAADAASPEPIYALGHAPDSRLPAKTRILGVYQRGHARAYVRGALTGTPVLEETLGGEPIVVLYDAGRDLAACYSRRFAGRVLSFSESGDPAFPAIDRESGTRYDVAGRPEAAAGALDPIGLAVDGAYWFAWSQVHPRTELAPDAVQIVRQEAELPGRRSR